MKDKTNTENISSRVNLLYNNRIKDVLVSNESNLYISPTLRDAYKVQDKLVDQLNWQIGGWKLGGTNTHTQEKFQCESLYFGPIESKKIIYSHAQESFKWFFPLVPKGEAEISFRLSGNVEELNELNSLDQILDYVDAFSPSIELPFSVIPSNDKGLNPLVEDLCASGFLVLGKIEDISDHKIIEDLEINIFRSDELIETGNTSNLILSPLETLFEFLLKARSNKLKLYEGQWIATGGCTSCLQLDYDSPIKIAFGDLEPFYFLIHRNS